MLFGDFFKDAIFVDASSTTAMEELAQEFHGAVAMALHGFTSPPFWLALAGVVSRLVLLPGQARRCRPRSQQRFGRCYTLLDNKYYFDWFNENVLAARRARCSAAACGRAATQAVIDGVIVNGTARSWSAGIAGVVRRRADRLSLLTTRSR